VCRDSQIQKRLPLQLDLAVGVCLVGAGEFWMGHYFFALDTVTVAVGCDQDEPLIEVEVAECWMLEEVAAQIGLGADGKILRQPTCGFEFRRKLPVRPAACGNEDFRRLETNHAGHCVREHCVVLALQGAVPGRIGLVLQSVLNTIEHPCFDGDNVLDTFGDSPAVGRGAVVPLFTREALRHAQQALARFRQMVQCEFAFSGSHFVCLLNAALLGIIQLARACGNARGTPICGKVKSA
jgi:hypothetical protein